MAFIEPLVEPVGKTEGRRNQGNNEREKKEMASAKRPSLPGGSPCTLMIARRMCTSMYVCVCVILS